MAQRIATQHGGEPNPLDTNGLCLLSLDGGGVRGLSTLYILKGLMTRLNNQRRDAGLPSVKPCEVFDLIGGTSTGGLIAIMLGRLEMDVEDCITAYSKLMEIVFEKQSSWLPVSLRGRVKARFDSEKLRVAIEEVVCGAKASTADLFNDGKDRGCRTFVCSAAKETAGTTRLRSYTLPDERDIPATICQAALATSAATGFFDPVSIGARQFVDGALGANNPVDEVEGEAANIWSSGKGDLKPLVKCFISIGTGNPGKKAIEDNMVKFLSGTLVGIVTETENTERKFIARWAQHFDEKRYFRFNVDQGLQDVGLAEYKEQGKMEAATDEYLQHQAQKFRVRDCVENLQQKQNGTETSFALDIKEYERRRVIQSQTTITNAYYIPFSKNRYFVGRRDELDVLRQKLIIDRDCQKISIVGLGGTGKTQVALQFAYIVKETLPEFSIFWLPALSIESFEQACADIARVLHMPQVAGEEVDAKELVREYISSIESGRWLLVLDNADDLDILFGTGQSKGIVNYLPESEEGMVVFTTRTLEVATSLTRGDVIDLGAMNRQDATSFLEKSLIKKDLLRDDAATNELLDELTYLPLAIAQAAAYLNVNRMTIARYLRLLQNTEQDIVSLISREFRDDTRYKNSPNAVAATWVVSFSQIREHDAVAADLLSFMSCIEWKAIPRSILPGVQPEERMESAIGILCAYSFLRRRDGEDQEGEKQNDEDTYDTHRLVHLATSIWISQHGDMAAVTNKAVQHVAEIFPSDDYANHAVWRAYMPHVLRLLRSGQDLDGEEKSKLCLWVGRCLQVDGRVQEAVRWLEECCRWRSRLDEEHLDRVNSQHELARAYLAGGQVKKAIELLENIVAVREKVQVEEHPDRLASQHELARAYLAGGKVKKAIELLEHVMAMREKMQVEEHPDRVFNSQHVLARAYLADGQVKKAIELLEHVMAMREKVQVEEHPDRIDSQHVLARAYLDGGQVKKAIELLEHVVTVREKIQLEEHPERINSQHELARAYLADGQVKKAIELLENIVAVREKVQVEEHPDRLASQHELARAYLADGQVKKAIELLEHVMAIELLEHVVTVREKVQVEEHPERINSQHELARAYLADGQVKKAIEPLEHVMAMREKMQVEEHPDRVNSQHVLARAYLADGQVKKAIELLEHVMAMREKMQVEEHPDRVDSQHVLARAYLDSGQVKKAIELLEHVVTVREKMQVEEHPERINSQHELARAYLADGQVKKAIELLEHVMAMREKVQVEEHPDRLASQYVLAQAYLDGGQVKKAIELLEHVVTVREKMQVEEHPERINSQHELARAYLADGQVKKAIELLEHVMAMRKKVQVEEHPDRLASQYVLAQAYRVDGQVKEAVEPLEHVSRS